MSIPKSGTCGGVTGSWLAVVITSRRLFLELRANQPQPEPWIPRVAAVTSFLRFSKPPRSRSTALANALPSGYLASADCAGARFFQKSEWLMWPPPLNLRAAWSAICDFTSLADCASAKLFSAALSALT